MKQRLGAVLIVALCLTVAGCRGLPETSGVSVGKSIGAADDSEPLSVKPDGPLRTDDEKQVATGFVRAHMDASDNYAIARSFLAGPAQSQWKPSERVRIYDASRDISAKQNGAHEVRVTLHQVATLSPDGHLTHETDSRPVSFTLKMTHTSGGWRVAKAPAGLGAWISQDDLSRLYSHVNVYYVPRGSTHLIPDVRWLPRKGLPTALARAALQQPPATIAHAVQSPYPQGTKLDVDAVPVDSDGVAQVGLSTQASAASTEDRKRMWAALTATLMQAPLVSGVNLTVGGGSLDAAGVHVPLSEVESTGYEADDSPKESLIARSGAYLAWTRAAASDAVSGTDQRAAQNRPTLPAISAKWAKLASGRSGAVIAGVSRDGKELAIFADGAQTLPKLPDAQLLRPIVDPQGWVLIAGEETKRNQAKPKDAQTLTPSTVWLANAGRKEAVAFDATALDGANIKAWTMSEDGTRIAMLVQDRATSALSTASPSPSAKGSGPGEEQTHTKVQIATVERSADGKPLKFGPAHTLNVPVTELQDVAWANATSLAVLGIYEGRRQPVLAPLDGGVTPLGTATNAVGLASINDGGSGLFLRMRNGVVMTRAGSTWQSFLSGGDVIVPLG